MLRDVVTVEEVLNSPMIADPLHRLDCCVISDGGGAVVVVRPEIAQSLKRPLVKVRGRWRSDQAQIGRASRPDLHRPLVVRGRGVRGSRR